MRIYSIIPHWSTIKTAKYIAIRVMIAFLIMSVGMIAILRYRTQLDANRFEVTQRQLSTFSTRLQVWVILLERIPGPGLKDAIEAMLSDAQTAEELKNMCSLILEGKDAWGSELVYHVNNRQGIAEIRSLGANREYDGDGEESDDIRRTVSLPKGLKR